MDTKYQIPPVVLEAFRSQFNTLISAPPYEQDVTFHRPDSAWPGTYQNYSVQLAWDVASDLYSIGYKHANKTITLNDPRLEIAVRTLDLIRSLGTAGGLSIQDAVKLAGGTLTTLLELGVILHRISSGDKPCPNSLPSYP